MQKRGKKRKEEEIRGRSHRGKRLQSYVFIKLCEESLIKRCNVSNERAFSIAFSLSHTLQDADKGCLCFHCATKDELLGTCRHNEDIHTPGGSVETLVKAKHECSFM